MMTRVLKRGGLPAATVLLLAVMGGGAGAQESKSFTDWSVVCDNARTCSGIGFTPEEAGFGPALEIRRGGEPDAPVQARLLIRTDLSADKLDPRIGFDEPGFESVFGSKPVAKAGPEDFGAMVEIDPGQIGTLVAALRKAKALKVSVIGEDGNREDAAVSLAGSVAALRFLDDRQRRADTLTALVARGAKPAGTVPPPPALPRLTVPKLTVKEMKGALPKAVEASWKKACESWEFAREQKLDTPEIRDLGGGARLYMIGCDSGAYNLRSLFFLARGGAIEQLLFETPELTGPQRKEDSLVNASFASSVSELPGAEPILAITFFDKGRGLGDCGITGVHVWDGKAFRLARYSAMPECRGAAMASWPTLYRAEVTAR